MTFFGPPRQDVDKLYMLAPAARRRERRRDREREAARAPGTRRGSCASRGSRARSPAHKLLRVKLKLAKSKLRSVKRLLKRGKRLKVKIVARAQDAAGGPWTKITRTVRLKD